MPPDHPPTLHLLDVEKRFGDTQALDGVTFDWDGPGVVGVVGPNGSGKTTLIRCLLGLVAPSDGVVLVDEDLPRRLHEPGGMTVGYMPQREALYEDLTVEQNVAFFARLHRVARSERRAAVDDALGFAGLSDRAGDRVRELSGGMRRRVSLACAIVHTPQLLVLDEPTVGVDPELRAEMWDGFGEMTEEGRLVLISTHYLGEAERCDQVLLLRGGRVLAFDTPEALEEATGTDELEAAFLELLERREVA